MKKQLFAFVIAATLILAPILAVSGPALYNISVSATQTNTVVTPTAANGRATFVRVLNDGASPIYVDFDRVAVAASTTAVKISACEGRDFAFDNSGVQTLGIITDTGGAATARVQVHYLKGLFPQGIATQVDRIAYVNNSQGCASNPLVTANGATKTAFSNSELMTLSTGGATTDSSANLLPANSVIDGVVCRVTTTITTATDWGISDPTTTLRFSAVNSTMTAGTVQVGMKHLNPEGAAEADGPVQAAAAKLRITTTGTPGAGAVRCTVFGYTLVAPTS